MSKHFLIIGGAGFIGSNLINHLLVDDNFVTIVDDFSRGKPFFLTNFINNCKFRSIQLDVSSKKLCEQAFIEASYANKIDEVWHLAANSDIPAGVDNPEIDLNQTFMTTFYVLENMKKFGIKKLNFASSSAIYGDFGEKKIYEEIGPLMPISNYGAMKLASEAQIYAASESYLDIVNIFRFPNVVGVPATHGVILDFINRLNKSSEVLQVLGNGTQRKAYLHVSDLIEAMLVVNRRENKIKNEIINIGPLDDGVTVKWIAEQVVKRINPKSRIVYGESNKGWVGDVPKFFYSTDKLQKFGWIPKLNSEMAIIRSIDEIAIQVTSQLNTL
jgi:UDP-glucose 4-epimerase